MNWEANAMPAEAIALDEITSAAERISDVALRTPLIPFHDGGGETDIYLKLENLQPIGAFKIRGAANKILARRGRAREEGVFTASAGNMAQGVAWMARLLEIPCSVIVPDHAPEAKLNPLRRMGAEIVKVTFDEWWQLILSDDSDALPGVYVHPVSDPAVMAGNGTIGLEILEDLPDVDAVLIPYGGGGLSCGIASALRAQRSKIQVYACEVATAAPLAASWQAGEPVEIDYQPSFVDGIGGKSVLPSMWPRARSLLDGSLVVDLEAAAEAIRQLVEHNKVVAEGAGAVPVAAAVDGLAGSGRIVCVVSGGNLDPEKLAKILKGQLP